MRTVLDLNAALGQMWTAMDDSKFEVSYLGLDWAPNIMDIVGQTFPLIDGSESHVVPPLCWANPSVPFDLGKSFDVVISIVSGGQFVKKRREGWYLDNLLRPAGDTIVVAWRTDVDVVEEMRKRGAEYDESATAELSKASKIDFHRNHIKVFRLQGGGRIIAQ